MILKNRKFLQLAVLHLSAFQCFQAADFCADFAAGFYLLVLCSKKYPSNSPICFWNEFGNLFVCNGKPIQGITCKPLLRDLFSFPTPSLQDDEDSSSSPSSLLFCVEPSRTLPDPEGASLAPLNAYFHEIMVAKPLFAKAPLGGC